MNLEDALNTYYDHSKTLSNINRQLALSGIAIIWFFIHPEPGKFNLGCYKYPFISFCLAMFFDLLHYAVATLIWGCYHRYKELRIGLNTEFTAPRYINWFSIGMLGLKVLSTNIGYILLLKNTIIGSSINS